MFEDLLKSLRPRQWTKNLLVFGALLFIPGALFNAPAAGRSALAFILFSLAASAGYLVNDIKDREYDQCHPKKKFRPIACGRLSIPSAIGAVVILLLVVLAGGLYLDLTPFTLPPPATPLDGIPFAFLITIASYMILSFFYSVAIKKIPLLDVLVLSIGFTLRAVAGAVAIKVIISPWLLLCTGLLSLFLALGKRRQELIRIESSMKNGAVVSEKVRQALSGYTVALLDQLLLITSSMLVMGYSLYTFSASGHADNRLMLTIPFVVYGIFRYLYLIHRNHTETEAPEEVLLKDLPMKLTLILWIVSVAILFLLPGFVPVD